MTENLPAVRSDPTPATTDTDSWTQVVGEVSRLANVVADTDFVPKTLRGSAAAVTAAILYGREVGLPPMTALTQVYVVQGRPAMHAEAQRALVLAAGHDLEIRQATGAQATVAGRRRGSDRWSEVTWTLDMAKAAQLIRGDSGWTKYPRAMLVARASAELCRQLFPDVIHGFAAVEELEDTIPNGATPAPQKPGGKTTVQRATPAPKPAKSLPEPRTPAAPTETPTTPPEPPQPALPGEPGYDNELPSKHSPGEPTQGAGDPPGETQPSAASAPHGGDPPDAADTSTWNPTKIQMAAYHATFKQIGVTDRDERLWITSQLIGHPLQSSNDLTRGEVRTILDTLRLVQTREHLQAIVEMAAAGIQGTLQEPPDDEDQP